MYREFKEVNYGKKVCAQTEEGWVLFDPDSMREVAGIGKMTYDEYLDVQIASFGKTRSWFEMCYHNCPMGFVGQIEKITKENVCFKRILVNGMFPDGIMFFGKEDHVWITKKGFENFAVGDNLSFFAEVYRYVKTGKGKQIDYSLREPREIEKVEEYRLPEERELTYQQLQWIRCEACYLNEHCNRVNCILG